MGFVAENKVYVAFKAIKHLPIFSSQK